MHVCLRAVWHAPLALGSITPFTSGLTPNALSRPKDGDVLAVLACAATTRYLHNVKYEIFITFHADLLRMQNAKFHAMVHSK